MVTESKVTEIFCIADDFCKEFESEISKNALPSSPDAPKRRRQRMISDAEAITILICFPFQFIPEFQALLSLLRLPALETSLSKNIFIQPFRRGDAKMLHRHDNVPETGMLR